MNQTSEKTFKIVLLLLNLIIAIAYAFWASGAREMQKLDVLVSTPIFGLIIGLISGLIDQALSKTGIDRLFIIIVYVVLLNMFSGLVLTQMVEPVFTQRTDQLTEQNRLQKYQGYSLGDGKYIYFDDTKMQNDLVYKLNFEYQGKREITRDELTKLAQAWLINQGYEVGELEGIYTTGPLYYKEPYSFTLEHPGQFPINIKIKNSPASEPKITGISVQPKYQAGTITFGIYGYN